MYITANRELYHHGIKGQKWGVRRYQNPDGSYTSAGRSRYGFGQVKKSLKERSAREREDISKNLQFHNKKLSKEEADKLAAQQQRIKRTMMIVGGVAVTGIVGYSAYKYGKQNFDSVIKAGKTLDRIALDTNLHDKFYAVNNARDRLKYQGQLGIQRSQYGDVHKIKLGANTNLKVAGNRNARKAFYELMKNDQQFANSVKSMPNNVFGNKAKDLYDKFNQALVGDTSNNDAANKFIDYLKTKGYSGVKDVNDQKYSGYKAINPMIMFNTGKEYTIKSSHIMSKAEINKKFAKEALVQVGENTAKNYALYASLGIPYAALIDYNNKQTTKRRQEAEAKAVKKG